MEINSEIRRKRIKVWVSDEERALIEAKAEYYGYKTLASYIRDAAIYEKITNIDFNNRKEIYDAYSANTKELKKIAKEIRHLSKYATQLSQSDLTNISNTMFNILKKQKEMLNLIDTKLNLNIWQEINHSDKKEN